MGHAWTYGSIFIGKVLAQGSLFLLQGVKNEAKQNIKGCVVKGVSDFCPKESHINDKEFISNQYYIFRYKSHFCFGPTRITELKETHP
uniref:Uncharacterized protein n=1 Tax=Ipomoea trifida TaxID=35884 RepID=A0PAB5_IPOTF|nr:hypothetical protein [Ipomoea trifida]